MLTDLLARNKAWSARRHAEEPGYFTRLAALQAPEFFWIGCSDSRVPANVVAGLDPGEVFVPRNVANIVHSSDMNLLSALEFAVDALHVREIILCGHDGCGGVKAATEDLPHGLAGCDAHGCETVCFEDATHPARVGVLARADGLMVLPADADILPAGALVAFRPFCHFRGERG